METEQQGQEESQATQTQETQEKSNGQEQHSETKKDSATLSDEKKAEYIAEGRRKAEKELASKLGYKQLDSEKLASIVKEHKAAEDAKKTAEERLAEAGIANQTISEENETLKSLIGKRAESDFNALSDEAKGFVSEFAGDDPVARMKYMGSESFQKLVGKQAPRIQGNIKNAPDQENQPDSYKDKFEAMKNESDPHKRREMAKALEGQASSGLMGAFDDYFKETAGK
jgi:hypothetical protein